MPIVFGSPEAKTILEKDRELYGDSRYPDGQEHPVDEAPTEWRVTTTVTGVLERTYYVEAFTIAEAREMVLRDRDWADERMVDDLGDEKVESVEKVERD